MAELIYGGTGVWFMIGALLVFFMQAGFAMVEKPDGLLYRYGCIQPVRLRTYDV